MSYVVSEINRTLHCEIVSYLKESYKKMPKSTLTIFKKMKKPFHVVHIKENGKHWCYDIMFNNKNFLVNMPTERTLKKQEAYAICKYLNINYNKKNGR